LIFESNLKEKLVTQPVNEKQESLSIATRRI